MYQIVWRGIVHDTQGYARASREYLLALDKAGVDIKVEPLNFGTPSARLLPEQASRLKELIDKPLSDTKKKILIYHAQPYGIDPVRERANGFDKVIINTVWETTRIPASWFPNVNQADAVIVPSKQNAQALLESGVTSPIYLVGHGADTNSFNPNIDPFPLIEAQGRFNFLSVFQWQHRKSPEILLRAYLEEFSSSDNVSLIIKSYWGNEGKKADQRHVKDTIGMYKEELGKEDTAPIFYSGSLFNEVDMRGLYTLSDIFVLPSKGEGVGLPYIEAMSSGLPCIATGWGGQTDFINEANGFLIDYKLEPCDYDRENSIAQNFFHLFTNEMQWAFADINHLKRLMRSAYESPDLVKQKGMQARKDMENMSWDQIGIIFKDVIEKVVM